MQEETKCENFDVVQDSPEGKGYVFGIPHGKKITRYMRKRGLISARSCYISV
jgi:hypothetical protein